MPKRIIFLHPDLGVGGAERLVVDAAVALKKHYDVSFITSHHDKNHCFKETKDNTIKVKVVGEWIPRNIFGRFYALCAYLKMIYCALYIAFFEKPDLVFCDLVSVCIPFLYLSVNNIIYYCHYPDQLLSKNEGFLKQIYRLPLNWLEEKALNYAQKIYVNSEFTKKVYIETFKTLSEVPTVLYPSINTDLFDIEGDSEESLSFNLNSDKFIFLSINRYERKKHVDLVVNALACLKEKLPQKDWERLLLIIAGGYDLRVEENIEYFNELNELVNSIDLNEKVLFLKSPSDFEKVNLLRRCNCLVYTPPNEHFGIVPLEAMYCKKPVIACNSGGPKETVVNGKTGILCDFTVEAFSSAMVKFVEDKDLGSTMGTHGQNQFIEKFSFQAFSDQLFNDVESMLR